MKLKFTRILQQRSLLKKTISNAIVMGLLFNSGISSFAGVLSECDRYETFKGTNITINDILEEDKIDVEIEGNTLINLLSKEDMSNSLEILGNIGTNLSQYDNGFKITSVLSSNAYKFKFRFKLNPILNGRTFTLLYDSPNKRVRTCIYNGTDLKIEYSYINENPRVIELPQDNDERYLYFDTVGEDTQETYLINNVMLVKGNHANKSYSYFEGMKSVGQDDKNVHKVEIISTSSDGARSNKKEVLLTEPLRKLSDEVKDRIIKKDGTWFIERNCRETRVLDTWGWVKSTVTEDYYWCKNSEFILNENQINVLCNKLKSATTVESNNENFYTNNYDYVALGQHMNFGAIAIDLNPDTLINKSVEGFKEYLRNNEVNIIYPLSTPIYEEVTNIHLITYLDVTYISNNSNIPANMKVTVDRVSNRAKEFTERAISSSYIDTISQARYWINLMKDSWLKDSFQTNVNSISNVKDMKPIEKKNISTNMDIYLTPQNTLAMTLNTNNITFDEVDNTGDIEKLSALEITINSSLPYELSASLHTGIYNSNKDASLPVSALNIKESNDLDYKTFTNVDEKLIIKEDNLAGINTHKIDLKLRAGSINKADTYKTTLKFEAIQK